jgi:BNR repeat-like domain
MNAFTLAMALTAAASTLAAAPAGSVQFETKPRAVTAGIFPQMGVRVTGDLSLLMVKDGDLWYLTSSDGGDSFPARVRVNETPHDVLAHSENMPILVLRSMRELYVAWQAHTDKPEGSTLRLARSIDWGLTFSKPVPVDPESKREGFYTMRVSPKGDIYVAWLDGRDHAAGAGVYVARSTDRGLSFHKSVRVASKVCPCCRPSLAFGEGDTVYVSWRGVLPGDIRDMLVASSRDAGATWSKPSRVSDDDWRLNACPHSGDSMAVLGRRLFIAWHTVRRDKGQLFLAWSDDGGKTFSPPVNLRGAVLDANHPRLVAHRQMIGVVFEGRDPGKDAGWGKRNAYYREIDAQGNLSPLTNLGHLDGSVNYPELLYGVPDHVFVAWHETSDTGARVVLIRGRGNGTLSAMEDNRHAH